MSEPSTLLVPGEKTGSPFGRFVSDNRYKIVGFAVLAIVLLAYPNVVQGRWVDAANLVLIAGVATCSRIAR